MILCHKCAGILSSADTEDTTGLSGCGCISGWIRGFEPTVDRAGAIAEQVSNCDRRIRLYTGQGRGSAWIDPERERLERLVALQG